MRKQQQKSKNSHKEQRNKSVSGDYPTDTARGRMLEEINRLFDRLTTEELKAVVETIKKLQDRD